MSLVIPDAERLAEIEEKNIIVVCPPYSDIPTLKEYNETLGNYAIGLYVFASLVVAILAVQYGILAGNFKNSVPSSRKVATFWVNSVYLVVAIFSTIAIVLPKSADFVWLTYRVYVGMAMSYFVTLTMSWYGGETAMLQHIGEGVEISFRVRPCCCCICCPKAAPFSKNKIRFMKACVYQMPYVQGVTLFLMTVLARSGYLFPGDMSPIRPYIYCVAILTISFFLGIWGLFMFMSITKEHALLVHFNYRKKSLLLKLMVVFVNIQGILIDVLARYEVITCVSPGISSMGMAIVYNSLLSLIESLVLGTLCFWLYSTSDKYL